MSYLAVLYIQNTAHSKNLTPVIIGRTNKMLAQTNFRILTMLSIYLNTKSDGLYTPY